MPAAVREAAVGVSLYVVDLAAGLHALRQHLEGAEFEFWWCVAAGPALFALGRLIFLVFGVIIVPGLYFIFGKLQEGRYLIRDEDKNPLSEDLVDNSEDNSLTRKIKKIIARIRNKKDNETAH